MANNRRVLKRLSSRKPVRLNDCGVHCDFAVPISCINYESTYVAPGQKRGIYQAGAGVRPDKTGGLQGCDDSIFGELCQRGDQWEGDRAGDRPPLGG
jgi:hypothetical protein